MTTSLQRNGLGNFGPWHSWRCYSAMCHQPKHYCRSTTVHLLIGTPLLTLWPLSTAGLCALLHHKHHSGTAPETTQEPKALGSSGGPNPIKHLQNETGPINSTEAPIQMHQKICCQVPQDTLRGLLPISWEVMALLAAWETHIQY